jgi:ABC-type lipoprotein export system ATPase subunit
MTGEPGRGSEWRIWDLHVHTPSSLVQQYGSPDDATWARYLDELENLPPDIRVIGVNDYWFLDGYRRVARAKAEGRLANLDAIFPVLELRINQFGGTESNLSRVNFHVIFDPALDVEIIQQQFLDRLHAAFTLDPVHELPTWDQAVTRESISELGRLIKASVPTSELPKYGSDLEEGFNSLTVPYEELSKVLSSSSALRGRYVTAVGKTEWASIKWNDQSIASKKTIVAEADLLFTAYENSGPWAEHVEKLRSARVNHRILDCSDAHHWSDSDQKDRLGACQTWINSTPTLAGLRHALREFAFRVHVGLEPPILARIRRAPERFIDSITVSSNDPTKHRAFSYALPLNSGFVAVVGNKGQGKSALLDSIALAGNSSRTAEFAFLTRQRFLAPSNPSASQYFSELLWQSGARRLAHFSDGHDRGAPVAVEYLPQKYVERVCSVDPLSGAQDEFEAELRAVLFTHIPEEARLGERSFDGLLQRTAEATRQDLGQLRQQLQPAIDAYVELARFRADNRLTDVEARLRLKEADVTAAQAEVASAIQALAVVDSESQHDADLAALRTESEALASELANLRRQDSVAVRETGATNQRLLAMDAVLARAVALRDDAEVLNLEAQDIQGVSADAGVAPRRLVSVSVDASLVVEWKVAVSATQEERARTRETLGVRVAITEDQLNLVNERLQAVDSARELSRQRLLQCQERLVALKGSADDPSTEKGLLDLRGRVIAAPGKLDASREAMLAHVGKIYAALAMELTAVEGLYAPAAAFIAGAEVVQKAGLEFRAELRVMPLWKEIPTRLDGRRIGDLGESLRLLPERVSPIAWSLLEGELRTVLTRLEAERGQVGESFRSPDLALRTGVTLETFLTELLDLAWIETRFGLTGDGEPLAQLSPGQRGLVLALFYLIVDRRQTPLLLDQPEENLDNATIASLLVPAIKEAAGRRQTIIVTHNANLAIVGDADQIIHCRVVDRTFEVSSGCISELDTAQSAVDILEGTMPAFDNRRHKYEAFPSLAVGGATA